MYGAALSACKTAGSCQVSKQRLQLHRSDCVDVIVMNRILEAIQSYVQVGDYVKLNYEHGLGEVIGSGPEDRVVIRLFKRMDSATSRRFFIRPVTVEDCPLASQDGMIEVYQSSDEINLVRSAILDIAFIVPLEEVESGLFFLSGADNVYFARFIVSVTVARFKKSYYFGRHLIGVRLFTMINALSQHVRKALYHNPESGAIRKCIRMNVFSMEAFWYLVFKMSELSLYHSSLSEQLTFLHWLSLLI
jgi:hypothetical protein